MAVDPFFEMVVEDTFTIDGRGIVATGKVARGTLRVGNRIVIRRQDVEEQAVVAAIETFRKAVDVATVGDNVGVLFRRDPRGGVQRGDELSGAAFDSM